MRKEFKILNVKVIATNSLGSGQEKRFGVKLVIALQDSPAFIFQTIFGDISTEVSLIEQFFPTKMFGNYGDFDTLKRISFYGDYLALEYYLPIKRIYTVGVYSIKEEVSVFSL